jgi:HSP20 family protein
MPTLIRRDNRDPSRARASEFAFDPFRLMDAVLGGWSAEAHTFAPSFEVKETKDAYVFKADLPGVPQADVEIQMTGNILTISGHRKHETVQEGERYFALERGFGQFSRSFALPEGTDGEHVTAQMRDGVLNVVVPKKPEVQPRRIAIGEAAVGNPSAKA